ncbi:MAG: hypothetical protein NVS1B5_15160 [Gemmatimonadaceae bacterium]
MFYIVETNKSFNQASADPESAVMRHGFGTLHVHDLGTTLRSRGIAFGEECKVFTEKGKTKIGLINPGQRVSALSQDGALVQGANEVEEKTIQMVDEAK